MPDKTIINDIKWFRDNEGEVIATSPAIEITKEKIQSFCRAIDNEEWVHWDEKRCEEAFGGIIAPLFMAPALFPTMFFESFDYGDIDALFSGTDRFRLISPILAGDLLSATTKIDRVEDKDKGIAVYYDVTFNVQRQDKPVAVGTFVLRYW
jgi:acyl dehydratase